MMKSEDLLTQLSDLFNEVLNDFFEKKIHNNLEYLVTKRWLITDKGITRYNSSNYGGILKPVIEPHMLVMHISNQINGFKSVEKLYQFIVDERLYPYKITGLDEDKFSFPSIYSRYISGLIVRMYELSNFSFQFSEENFSIAISELIDFIKSDSIRVVYRTNLIGPIGAIEEIQINESVSIKKGSLIDSQLFCSYYSRNFEVPVYEGDYFIEENIEIEKPGNVNIKSTMNEIYSSLVLQTSGTIILGNTIRVGKSWPFIPNGSLTLKSNNHYDFSGNKFIYNFDDIIISDLTDTYNSLLRPNTDAQISKALVRLQKSKSTPNIEEKLLEMILAVEYLINTQPFEVTYQMSLKIIKLFNEINTDESLLKKIKKFFELRGNLIHGRKPIENNTSTIETIIFFEKKILKIFMRVINEFSNYTLVEINQALDKAIYTNLPIMQILINQKKSK